MKEKTNFANALGSIVPLATPTAHTMEGCMEIFSRLDEEVRYHRCLFCPSAAQRQDQIS